MQMKRSRQIAVGACLVACVVLSLSGWFGSGAAHGQGVPADPVNDRFTIRVAGEKYVLWGMRAGPLQKRGTVGGRFRLETGMKADEAAAQLATVEWDSAINKLDDPKVRTATVERRRPLFKDRERIQVEAEKKTGRVHRIVYEVEPVNRSHYGLLVYLNTDYGAGEQIVNTEEHVQIGYRTGPNQKLLVDGNRLGSDRPQWRLRYIIQDPTITGAKEEDKKPGEATEMKEIWPPTSQPANEKLGGLIQIYPPRKDDTAESK